MKDINAEESVYNRGRLFTILFVAALFAIGTFQVLTGNSGYVSAEMDDVHLGVCGSYGDTQFVELSAITDIQLLDSFSIGTCIEGKEVGNTVSGIYSNETLGQYSIYAYTNVPTYILVTHPNGILVFNCNTVSRTEDFYDQLMAWEPQ